MSLVRKSVLLGVPVVVVFGAGFVARSEIARRRREHRRLEERLRAQVADPGTAWLWPALRQIVATARATDEASFITVTFRHADGSEVVCRAEPGGEWMPRGVR
jgi:hypothetical protein